MHKCTWYILSTPYVVQCTVYVQGYPQRMRLPRRLNRFNSVFSLNVWFSAAEIVFLSFQTRQLKDYTQCENTSSSLKYNPLWVTLYLANTIEDKLSENWQQSHFLLITYIQRAVKARTPPAVCAEPGPRVDWTCAHSGNMHTHRPTYLSWLMGGGRRISGKLKVLIWPWFERPCTLYDLCPNGWFDLSQADSGG